MSSLHVCLATCGGSSGGRPAERCCASLSCKFSANSRELALQLCLADSASCRFCKFRLQLRWVSQSVLFSIANSPSAHPPQRGEAQAAALSCRSLPVPPLQLCLVRSGAIFKESCQLLHEYCENKDDRTENLNRGGQNDTSADEAELECDRRARR